MIRNPVGAARRAGVQIPPSPPRRSKVRFAPTSFYARGKKDVIRPLPCSSFPTATRYAELAVGGPPCGRHFSPLRNIDFNRPFQNKRTSERMSFCFGLRLSVFECSGQMCCPSARFSPAAKMLIRCKCAAGPCFKIYIPTASSQWEYLPSAGALVGFRSPGIPSPAGAYRGNHVPWDPLPLWGVTKDRLNKQSFPAIQS